MSTGVTTNLDINPESETRDGFASQTDMWMLWVIERRECVLEDIGAGRQ